MASTDAKNSRCTSATLVHTRTSGSAIATRRLISPAWFMPSSTTATSAPCRSSSSDSGRPMWLFRLPGRPHHPVPQAEKRRGHLLRRRLAGAARDGHDSRPRPPPHPPREPLQGARRVRHDDQRATGDRGRRQVAHRPADDRSARRRPPAPLRRSRGRPAVRPESRRRARPARSSACRSRSRTPRRRRPRSGGVRPSRRRCPQSSGSSIPAIRPPRRRSSARRATSTSSNGISRSPITWYFSCPFPAISTTSSGRASAMARSIASARSVIARCAVAVGGVYFAWPSRESAGRVRSAGTATPRLISSMIAAGSSLRGLSDVRMTRSLSLRGDMPHQRPLRPVTVAAGAEHRDEPRRRERPRRLEQVLQRVVGVRVVDDDRDVVARRRTRPGSARERPRGRRCPARRRRSAGRRRRRPRSPPACCRRSGGRRAWSGPRSIRPA